MSGTSGRGIEAGFVIFLEHTVEGPEQQRKLVEGFVPGYTAYRTVELGPHEVES